MSIEERNINSYKKKFDKELRHIKLILMNRKNAMSLREWMELITYTKKAIISSPGNFFREIPEDKILKAAVDKVFAGFLEDIRIRDSQKTGIPPSSR